MHLEITQKKRNIPEIVEGSVIGKLYDLAYENTDLGIQSQLDASSTLSGHILPKKAYQKLVEYLENKFSNLRIDVNEGNYYAEFADLTLQKACAVKYGDGYGTTRSQLSMLNKLYMLSSGNLNSILSSEEIGSVNTLEDFLYFTGILNYAKFIQMPAGHTYNKIKFPSVTLNVGNESAGSIVRTAAQNSGKITINEIDWNNVSFSFANSSGFEFNVPDNYIFMDVNFVGTKNLLPVMATFPPLCRGNLTLNIVVYPEGVTTIYGRFLGCTLTYLEFPSTLTTLGDMLSLFKLNGGGSSCMVFKSVNPPTLLVPINTNNSVLPYAIYVPNGSVKRYKNSYTSLSDLNLIKPMSEMTATELEKGTVTQEDMERT